MLSQQVLSIFFAACSLVGILHIVAIVRDKDVQGVSTIPTWVFLATNLYEVFYFGSLQQWYAVAGAVFMFVCNVVWLGLVWWYRLLASVRDRVRISLDFKG